MMTKKLQRKTNRIRNREARISKDMKKSEGRQKKTNRQRACREETKVKERVSRDKYQKRKEKRNRKVGDMQKRRSSELEKGRTQL
jgi:hypothetical protein